ncbi:hypothetical protein SPBRAN_1887 [uncultured Candidatus Thioglobus sp.]|nr:hypothetical protein SPBRAN_1887 [uncultured Candidatus Thioglobus sp.]
MIYSYLRNLSCLYINQLFYLLIFDTNNLVPLIFVGRKATLVKEG